MRKLKKISVFLIISGFILVTAAVLLQLFTPLGNKHPSFSSGSEAFGQVREIVAVSGALPITLNSSDSETCTVEWESGLPLIVSCDEYGTLRITEDDSFFMTLFSAKSKNSGIIITVPEKSYERIKLSSSSGDITCSDISCETVDIYTRNGNISVYGPDSRSKIKSESGDIYLSVSPFEGDMAVNGGTGDITMDIADFDFFMEFTTLEGSCTSYGFDNDIGGRKGDAALLSGKGGNTVKINTTTGNFIINKAEDK